MISQQNFNFAQGQTFSALLTAQLPGVPIPATGTTILGNTSLVISDPTNTIMPLVSVGDSITGPGLQAGVLVASISGTTITMTLPATAAGAGVALVIGAFVAFNLTGLTLLFTATLQNIFCPTPPPAPSPPITLNWTETTTPLLGQTPLVLPNTITENMTPTFPGQQPQNYQFQVWAVSASSPPVVTPLVQGIIVVNPTVSTRTS